MLQRPRARAFGPYGKTRVTSRAFATCKERATPPDGPKRSRPSGCVAFGAGLRAGSGNIAKDYSRSARALASTKVDRNAGADDGVNTGQSGRGIKTGQKAARKLRSPPPGIWLEGQRRKHCSTSEFHIVQFTGVFRFGAQGPCVFPQGSSTGHPTIGVVAFLQPPRACINSGCNKESFRSSLL